MSDQACVVAVDVGNSAAKLCVRRGEIAPTELDFSVSIRSKNWQAQAIQWVREQAGCRQTRWRIASVNQSAARSLSTAVAQTAVAQSAVRQSADEPKQVHVDFISRHDVPMKVLVDQPDRLGIDRLLSAYGAKHQFDGPLVVVDAGSAVTIDWVDASGQFCGGAIMPGLRMQADSLANGTDALPEIDWQSWKCGRAPATNTIDAIRLGLITGISASIDRLTQLYAQAREMQPSETPDRDSHLAESSSPTLVLTGGDAALISPYVQRPHHVVPNLVCRGVLELQ